MDASDIRGWPWHDWINRNRHHLIGALSVNYDLVLERSLYWNRIPFFYPGTDGKPVRLPSRGIRFEKALPLAKPHGSSNFGSLLRISPVGYPLPTHTWAGNAALRILRDAELLQARDLADIVTPGEWNVFPQYLTWAQMMHRAFRQVLRASNTLVIIGFSLGTADQEEFKEVLSSLTRDHHVVVADPIPSRALLEYLDGRGITPVVWRKGPEDL
ncbi:MAG TPA: hypothetical protein VEK37_15150 [Gemmatimonadaceae bacterium]|nr:hypothetical protein [Gemmatimonadaceae bacterium]